MPLYTKRTYRKQVRPGDMTCFGVAVKETDLWVCADRNLADETRDLIFDCRYQIESYMKLTPGFRDSLVPLPDDPLAPPVVKEMIRVTSQTHVGPMASVAGAIAQFVGRGLLQFTKQVIVENGGDIFLNAHRSLTVSVFAGSSALSHRLGLLISTDQMPLGVCSSSGTVGHSLSHGTADLVCVLSPSAALADAAATALGNRIRSVEDLERAAQWADRIGGILGGMAVMGDTLSAWGDVELVEV
ncbi:MAG: UPF0280 family protein [Deltaproteobacteria bacterium]|nr:UPF0280 family protein [Deltaproteobacteria bacterium]MBW2109913.1 UPF0280 family protein [Deltaproteobacteria bacterium]MBW2351864.1 UPF0280 family protein [Deltaproteobacteria bacterium]